MKPFIVAYSWHDEYSPIFLLGPDDLSEQEFISLCSSLVIPCAQKIVNDNPQDLIGWGEIINAISETLCEQHGFTKPVIPYFGLSGSSIIENETDDREGLLPLDLLKSIGQCNEHLMREMHEHVLQSDAANSESES